MNLFEEIEKFAEQPLTSQILLTLLKDFNRPYDKINELVKKGVLVQLRRGLYMPGPLIKIQKPEAFLIANHLYAPSYISIDAALFYWGLIPERVFEISSVTTRVKKIFKKPIGTFSYFQLPLPYYSFGITQVSLTTKQHVLVASPEKSLCDKIISTKGILLRSEKQVIEYLTEDLRIEKEALRNLNYTAIKQWLPNCPKKSSIDLLIKTLIKI